MTTLRFFILSFLTLAFYACSDRDKSKLKVLFDRVDNLEKGGKVLIKGVPVGEVTHFKLFGDSVLVDIKLADTIKIPLDSKFIITPSLISSSQIFIEPSDKTIYLNLKDTARGYYLKKGILDNLISDSTKREKIQQSLDTIGQRIKELLETSKDSVQKSNKQNYCP